MNTDRRRFIGGVAAAFAGMTAPSAFAAVRSHDRPALLSRALAALDQHSARIGRRDFVGLVDFSQRSGTPRFQIVDLGNGRIVASHLVAHGRGSDPANTGLAQTFSNRPGSNSSSRGSFVVGSAYHGKHGRSRRLHGLDPGNDLAYKRAIVIHGADYVSNRMALSSGRVGRSLGCFTVAQRDIAPVLDRLGPGSLLFADR